MTSNGFRHFTICLISIFQTLCTISLAADTLVLKDPVKEYFIQSNQLDFLLDTNNSYTIEEIIGHPNFKPFPKHTITGITKNNVNHWIKIILKNESGEDQRWLLENLDAHIQVFDLYLKTSDGRIIHHEAGYGLPFFIRDYQHKNFLFDLPLKSGDIQIIYIRARSASPNIFIFRVQTHQHFTYYSLNEYYYLGIFYGVLAIMALYNLLLFLYFKEKVYAFYFIYILSCSLLTLGDDGLGFQYIWPSYPDWNTTINRFAPLAFLISFYIYSHSFLKIRENLSSMNKWINRLFLTYVLLYLADLIFLKSNFGYKTFMFPFIFIYILSVISLKKGYRPARFYIAGYSFILLHFSYLLMRNNGLIIWPAILSNYTFNIGIILEILIFSIALSDRFKLIKKEREDALIEKEMAQEQIIIHLRENEKLKDKVNRELEAKVAERTLALNEKTRELSQANKKLEELYEKLNSFASDLDIRNWELQKKVNEETKARIIAKEVVYEEFIKIFPEEDSCMKYLSELKWAKGFVCKKCGNKKYSKGDKSFSRKCTVCKYTESVTASTLFHGVKFPLNKAFYIVYTTSYSSKKYTVDELADILELRRNTCWSFRKKILERKEMLETRFRVKEIDNWQSLFLD